MTHTHVLDSFRLDGKVALVTGGARGLGRTMALALAEAGADVALSGRTRDSLEEAATGVAAATGRRVQGFVADVTRADHVARLAAEVPASLGPVDILVNNAGINIRGAVHELSETDWDTVIDTNLKGPFLCSRAFGPDMAKRGWGRVINLGSILSVIGIAGRAPYASAKAGVTALTRVLALEWAAQGVTVNAVCPGPFGTDMNKPLLNDPAKYQEFVKNLPIGRWGELDELAGLIVLLASDASSFITGSSIFIDGGWTAR
jgi:NAD(P)-dependent dehydrogenase (short-subunit alcohol dehydrogenase family)